MDSGARPAFCRVWDEKKEEPLQNSVANLHLQITKYANQVPQRVVDHQNKWIYMQKQLHDIIFVYDLTVH